MTTTAVFGGTEWVDFATTLGTGDFMRWTELLDPDEFPLLVHLADWGWVNDLDGLGLEIPEAVSEHAPLPSVSRTLLEFQEHLVSRAGSAESVMLTNGLSSVDDPDGEWWIDGEPVSDSLGRPLADDGGPS